MTRGGKVVVSGCIFKGKLREFADGLDMAYLAC